MSTVCAVVVTHNRSLLLREALVALQKQTRRPDRIVVIDNASTDDTADIVAGEFAPIDVVRTKRNLGSSGGFTLGLQWAMSQGYDWIWLLDDDTIAEPDALEHLLTAQAKFPELIAPRLLGSKVVWTDGSLHPMNIQKPKLYDSHGQFLCAQNACMSIRFSSFVSMLVHRDAVTRHGLPVADYFLWNDDVEFSARIAKSELAVLVPASVVVHKTKQKHVPAGSVGGKYFFEVRNKLWLMRKSGAFSQAEKQWMFKSLVRRTWNHLWDCRFSVDSIKGIARGIWQGMLHSPRHNSDVLPRLETVSVENDAIAA